MKRYLTYILAVLVSFGAADVFAQATIDSLNQNADQSQGMYQPMNIGYTGISSLGMTQSAWLDPLQNLGEGQIKPAYSRYYWSPDLVLPIRLREGMITLVNFPEWEMIENVVIGDHKTFDANITGPNTVLFYPKSGAMVGVDTNIIVFGRSGNKYAFYARSESVNTERLTNSIIDIEVIDAPKNAGSASNTGGVSGGGHVNASKFRGGDSFSADSTFTRRLQKEDWIQSIPLDPTQFKFDVEVYVPNPDDVVIAPERVWRDNIFTYIDFGERALTMHQRPIVTLIIERVETPVGFRTKGPNGRLIVVEGIGDMVLRNGKRIVCLKLRRSDDAGLEYSPYAKTNNWDVPAPLPEGMQSKSSGEVQGFEPAGNASGSGYGQSAGSDGSAAYTAGRGSGSGSGNQAGGRVGTDDFVAGQVDVKFGKNGELIVPEYEKPAAGSADYERLLQLKATQSGQLSASQSGDGNVFGGLSSYRYGTGFDGSDAASISVELGTDADVNNLENLWSDLSKRYSSILKGYQPFYSVDAPADGQGRELFHLRIGPVKSIDTGDNICSQLGRNGVFCSVVRVQ